MVPVRKQRIDTFEITHKQKMKNNMHRLLILYMRGSLGFVEQRTNRAQTFLLYLSHVMTIARHTVTACDSVG